MNVIDVLIEQIDNSKTDKFDVFAFSEALQDAISTISGIDYKKEETRERHLDVLNELRDDFMAILSFRTLDSVASIANSSGRSQNFENIIARFRANRPKLFPISEQLSEKEINLSEPLNREDFSNSTDKLIKEIHAWDIDEFEKRTLVLSLNSIRRILDEGQTYSDSELRRRVKEVVADFQNEFNTMDKEFDTHLEAIMRWAKPAWRVGTGVLSIVASGAGIAGLLTSSGG